MNSTQQRADSPTMMLNSDGGFVLCPTVITEEELIRFLRIPEVSNAANHHHVIDNLKRVHGLPRIHLCGKTVYLTDAVKQWLQQLIICGPALAVPAPTIRRARQTPVS